MEQKIVNCPHCGKIIPQYVLNSETERPKVTCPQCGSQRNYKNGWRKTQSGMIQCYLCHDCGHRHS